MRQNVVSFIRWLVMLSVTVALLALWASWIWREPVWASIFSGIAAYLALDIVLIMLVIDKDFVSSRYWRFRGWLAAHDRRL